MTIAHSIILLFFSFSFSFSFFFFFFNFPITEGIYLADSYCTSLAKIPSKSSCGLPLSTTPNAVVGLVYPSNSSILGVIFFTLLCGTAKNWFSSVRRLPLTKNRLYMVRTKLGTELCPPPWKVEARKISADPASISGTSVSSPGMYICIEGNGFRKAYQQNKLHPAWVPAHHPICDFPVPP